MEKTEPWIDIWQSKKVKKYKTYKPRKPKFMRKIQNLTIAGIIIFSILFYSRFLPLIPRALREGNYIILLTLFLPLFLVLSTFFQDYIMNFFNRIYLTEDSLVETLSLLRRKIPYKDIKMVRIGQFRETFKEEYIARQEKFIKFIPFLKDFFNEEVVIIEVSEPTKEYFRFLGIPLRETSRRKIPGRFGIFAEDNKSLYLDLMDEISNKK